MKKGLLTILALLVISCSGMAGTPSYTRSAEDVDLSPGKRVRKLEKVRIYAERQPYKPWQNFQNRFIDRPLFTDISLRRGEDPEKNGFLKDVEIGRKYGLDGFAAISYQTLHKRHLQYLEEKSILDFGHAMVLVTGEGATEKGYQRLRETLIFAGKSPASARIDGKLLVWNYGSSAPKVMALLKTFVQSLRADREVPPFVIVAELPFLDIYNAFNRHRHNGTELTAAELDAFRNQVREALSLYDGLQLRVFENYRHPDGEYPWRILPTELYDRYMLPVLLEEFSRPENKDKLAGLYVRHGYINHLFGTCYGEYGTEAVRTYLKGAAKMNPDLLMLFEWNEANENTSFQPTVSSGRALERILAYARSCFDGQTPKPRPGDDTTVPNLILSTPRQVRLGEVLHLELLNVPDGTSGEITARLTLLDEHGKKIIALPEEKINPAHMRAVTWRFPAEELAPYQAVSYELETVWNGRKRKWDAFDYTRIMTTTNTRYLHTRVPLREILIPESWNFKVRQQEDGSYTADAQFAAPEELASLEIVDCGDEVYSLDRNREFDREKTAVFRGFFTSKKNIGRLSGRISIPGVSGWHLRSAECGMFEQFANGFMVKDELRIKTTFVYGGRGNFLLSVPLDAMKKNPRLIFRYDGLPEAGFDLAAVQQTGKYAGMIGKDVRLELYRLDNLGDYPEHMKMRTGVVQVRLRSAFRFPLLQLRAITGSGRIFRSPVQVLKEPDSRKESMTLWSETRRQPVTVQISTERLPDIRAVFSPEKGLFMGNTEAPEWDMMLGGGWTYSFPMDESCGDAVRRGILPPDTQTTAPEWVQENGRRLLRFSGQGEYLVLPRDMIPRAAPYELEFRIRREPVDQVLLRSCNFGTRRSYGLELVIENSKLKGIYYDMREQPVFFDTGLFVPAGKWTVIRVSRTVDEITFSADGKTRSFPFRGRGALFNMATFGGAGGPSAGIRADTGYFKGFLSDLKIRHNHLKKEEQ